VIAVRRLIIQNYHFGDHAPKTGVIGDSASDLSLNDSPKSPVFKPVVAAQYRIASALLQAAVGAIIRALGRDVPIGELIFARAAFGVAVLLVFYGVRGEILDALGTKYPLRHVGRGISSVSSSIAFFSALVYLPLVNVTVLAYSSPVIAVLFAAIGLRERVRVYRWSAVCVGFIGVLITVWPYLNSAYLFDTAAGVGIGLALSSAIGSALSAVQMRRLVQTERTSAIVFYLYAASMFVAAFSLPFWFVAPSSSQVMALLGAGALNVLSQTCTTQSYRYAPASSVVIFDYTTIVFAFVFGYFFLGELPQYQVYIGGTTIAIASIFIVLREQQLHKAIAAAAVATSDRV
jgi:drug/metabolite transporter (DMT)-like permease